MNKELPSSSKFVESEQQAPIAAVEEDLNSDPGYKSRITKRVPFGIVFFHAKFIALAEWVVLDLQKGIIYQKIT